MNAICVHWTLAAAIVAIWVVPGRAGDRGLVAFPKQDLQAKIIYCKTCHGLYGQGYRGYYSMPRLAGQQIKYFEDQLQAFVERRRTNSTMLNVARVLSPEMLTALATHFRGLDPKPLGGLQRNSWLWEKRYTRRAFRRPMLLHALLVTARRLKVIERFLAWRVNSMTTSSRHL
jgi:cytochrome c553